MGSFSSFPVLRERNGECPTNTIYVNHLIFVPTLCLIFFWQKYRRGLMQDLLGTVSSGAPRIGETKSMGTPTGLKCGLSPSRLLSAGEASIR